MRGLAHGLWGALGPAWRAIRARPGIFLGVALAVILLDLFLPLVVLSVFRKPWDHFSFNPWLTQLPQWVASPAVSLGRKIEFLSDVSLFWFIASSPYDAAEWGFSVGVQDLLRWLYMGLIFGAYFALWFYARGKPVGGGLAGRGGGRSGFAGAVFSTLGLFTSPCSVAGCGAPILPVLGLSLQGMTSGTLAALTTFSQVATQVVIVGMTLAVVILAWAVHINEGPHPEPAAGTTSSGAAQVGGGATATGMPPGGA
jgi:hypothetical protein